MMVGFLISLLFKGAFKFTLVDVVEKIYYYGDLKGPDGRPSLSKLTYAAGVAVALAGTIVFGKEQAKQENLSFGFLAYATLAFAFCLGKTFFNTILTYFLGKFGPQLTNALDRQSGAIKRPSTVAEG